MIGPARTDPANQYEEIRECDQLLRVMASFLQNRQVETPIRQTARSRGSPAVNAAKRFALCQHLATVFTTSNEDIAVTGVQTTEGLSSTILLARAESAQTKPLSVKRLHLSKESCNAILNDYADAHTFKSNIQDWMKLVTFWDTIQEPLPSIVSFVVYRARARIHQCLENGSSAWKVHPMDTLANLFDPEHSNSLRESTINNLTTWTVVVAIRSSAIRVVEQKYGNNQFLAATQSANWDHVNLNRTTAIHWLKLLLSFFNLFRDTFHELDLGTAANPKSSPNWKLSKFDKCTFALWAFRDLLDVKIYNDDSDEDDSIIHHLLSELPYIQDFVKQRPKGYESGSRGTRNVISDLDSPAQQVFHYLRKIPAHITSAIAVLKSLHGKILHNVTLIEYPNSTPTLEQWAIDRVREDVLKTFEHRKVEAQEILDNGFRSLKLEASSTFPGSVHAEAALMGLVISKFRYEQDILAMLQAKREGPADEDPTPEYPQLLVDPDYSEPQPSEEKPLQFLYDCLPFMTSDASPIGLVEDRCGICELFRQCLVQEYPGPLPKPSFNLPVSQGIAYPWVLPTAGVPLDIAKELVAKMRKQVERFVQGDLFGRLSSSISLGRLHGLNLINDSDSD